MNQWLKMWDEDDIDGIYPFKEGNPPFISWGTYFPFDAELTLTTKLEEPFGWENVDKYVPEWFFMSAYR